MFVLVLFNAILFKGVSTPTLCSSSGDCADVLQYRTTVAKMIAKQANDPRNPAQFIITTFHPQIIHETDRVYGVSHQSRISRYDMQPVLALLAMMHSIHSCHCFE